MTCSTAGPSNAQAAVRDIPENQVVVEIACALTAVVGVDERDLAVGAVRELYPHMHVRELQVRELTLLRIVDVEQRTRGLYRRLWTRWPASTY